jgi:hypothetical protein
MIGSYGFMMAFVKNTILSAIWLLVTAVFVPQALWGDAMTCSAQSPEHRIAVLELYTSEGCSSCPPADRFLRTLSDKGYRGDHVVPLAFHVDYWDYIGWKDRFAQSGFTQRQKRLAIINGLSTIYTPQYLVNGKDLQGWFSGNKVKKAIEAINQSKPLASLVLEVLRSTPENIEIKANAVIPDPSQREGTHYYLAIYENGLSTEVQRGENRGEHLLHDYVVRQFIGPIDGDEEGIIQFHDTIPLDKNWVSGHLGIAAFVQNRFTGQVLQAVQLALPCS